MTSNSNRDISSPPPPPPPTTASASTSTLDYVYTARQSPTKRLRTGNEATGGRTFCPRVCVQVFCSFYLDLSPVGVRLGGVSDVGDGLDNQRAERVHLNKNKIDTGWDLDNVGGGGGGLEYRQRCSRRTPPVPPWLNLHDVRWTTQQPPVSANTAGLSGYTSVVVA